MSDATSPDRAKMLAWMKGDVEAADFCEALLYVLHYYDDLADGDVPRDVEHGNMALWLTLVSMPSNRFYRAYQDEITALLRTSILEWHAANEFEKSDDRHLRTIAYTLRCNAFAVIVLCAERIGGYQWGRLVAQDVRRYGQRETLEQYLEGL